MSHSQLIVSYSEILLSLPLNCSSDSHAFFMEIWDTSLINLQEQVYALFMNANYEVISWRCINTGNMDETLFDIKLTLSCALSCMATNIVLAHNHPSGNLEPSLNDVHITGRLKSAAALMDILLIDHLIVTATGYFSLMEKALSK